MWGRNLFFVTVVVGGIIALLVSLFPVSSESRKVNFAPGLAREDEFRDVVKRVDDAFRTEWHDKKLSTAPRADDLTVARRLSLSLTGSVPSLEEIRQFESQPAEKRIDG